MEHEYTAQVLQMLEKATRLHWEQVNKLPKKHSICKLLFGYLVRAPS